MKRWVGGAGVLLLLSASWQVRAGSGGPESDLPPDLTHVEQPSCHLVEHGVRESLDAKTGLVEKITFWRVEPYVTYDDHREPWQLPKEKIAHGAEMRPGAIADVATGGEAMDVCLAWRNRVKAAMAAEHRKLGHKAKGD